MRCSCPVWPLQLPSLPLGAVQAKDAREAVEKTATYALLCGQQVLPHDLQQERLQGCWESLLVGMSWRQIRQPTFSCASIILRLEQPRRVCADRETTL